MIHLTVLLLVSLQTCSGLAVRAQQRAGFSVACQGLRTIGQMTREAEIVTEARVVDVSPARDNVYAVTLQVSLSCQHDSWRSNVIFIFQDESSILQYQHQCKSRLDECFNSFECTLII